MNREIFNKGMLLLAHAYQKQTTKEMFEAFFLALSDLPDAAFMASVERVVKTERFWPTPAVLRDHAAGSVAQEDGSELIAIVETAFRSVGSYRSVDFGDPAINAAVRLIGGWPALCSTDVDEWRAFRSKDFIKHALHFRRYGVPDQLGLPLPGTAEIAAARAGATPDPPVLFGGLRKEIRAIAAKASEVRDGRRD